MIDVVFPHQGYPTTDTVTVSREGHSRDGRYPQQMSSAADISTGAMAVPREEDGRPLPRSSVSGVVVKAERAQEVTMISRRGLLYD